MKVMSLRTESPLRNLTHLVQLSKSKEVVVIDPYSADPVLVFLKKNSLSLKAIINTHEHKDHTRGNLELQSETGAPVFGHRLASDKIPGFTNYIEAEKTLFSDEDERLESWETPGHTFCHFCFALYRGARLEGVFTGDTVFNAGVGNCFRGGEPTALYHTIQSRFIGLPNHCQMYPGHDYWSNNLDFAEHCGIPKEDINPLRTAAAVEESKGNYYVSSFGEEQRVNPFFHCKDLQAFVSLRKERDDW